MTDEKKTIAVMVARHSGGNGKCSPKIEHVPLPDNARAPAQSAGGGEPVAWRWRPKLAQNWTYNNSPEWIALQGDDIDSEPLYARAVLTDTAREGAIDADLVERIEAAICKAEGWDREHYDANPGAKAAAVIARTEYKRGWKEAREACVEIVDKQYYPRDIAEKLRALPDPVSPTNGKEGEL